MRPPCFLNIWRDCANDDCYFQFANGDIWHYFADATDDADDVTTATNHGRFFNFSVRRYFSPTPGYERFTGTLPITALLIYSYPPYVGIDPGPCGSIPPGCGAPWLTDIFSDSGQATFYALSDPGFTCNRNLSPVDAPPPEHWEEASFFMQAILIGSLAQFSVNVVYLGAQQFAVYRKADAFPLCIFGTYGFVGWFGGGPYPSGQPATQVVTNT